MGKGFTLIELIVYSAISSFLVIVVMQCTSMMQKIMSLKQREGIVQTGVYAGLDCLARDCEDAPYDPMCWAAKESNKIAWRTANGILGFEFKHDNLMRYSRSKDQFGRLRAPYSSLLIPHAQGSFNVKSSNGFISAIEVTMHSCSSVPWSITRFFLLHTGHIS